MTKLLLNVERFPLKVGITLDHKLKYRYQHKVLLLVKRTKSPSRNQYLRKEPFS